MSGDQSEEKTDPASDKKLRQLRQRGIIATAPTASEYIGLSAGLLTVFVMADFIITRLSGAFDAAFNNLSSPQKFNISNQVSYYFFDIHIPLLAILGATTGAAILFKIISQNGFVFSMEKVQFNFGAVNPWGGLKKLFKSETLVTLLAHIVRFIVLAIILLIIGYAWAPHMLNLDLCVPGCAWPTMWTILLMVLGACAILIIISIFFDIVTQKVFFLMEQRMTKTEVKRERKDMYGTPEVRSERKRIAREIVEGSDSVGSKRAAIYFFFEDDVVAFAFHPVKIPLPKLAARARGREASQLLRTQLEAQGVPGFRHKEIVEHSVTNALGENAKREIFLPLAGHLRELYK